MKKLLFLFIVLTFTLKACGQIDQTFIKPAYFPAGFYIGNDPNLHLTLPSGGIPDWNTMINKPLIFPPAIHNHDLLYKPLNWLPTWEDVQGKPQEIPLSQAIEELGYLPVPARSTVEIAAIVPAIGKRGIVFDSTLNVYKLWDGDNWSTVVITSGGMKAVINK